MRKLLFGSLLAIGLLACGSSGTKSQTATTATPAEHPSGQCPMMKDMAGAKVAATDTADGIAVEMTTTGDVAALRAHVHEMADMHNKMAAHPDGAMHHDMGSGEMHHDMGGGEMHHEMKMVPSRATVEDISNGARIVMVPNDASQLAELRSHVREHAAMMAKGECPMGMQPQSTPPADEHAGHHPPG